MPPLGYINSMRAKNTPYSILYCSQQLRKLLKFTVLAETTLKCFSKEPVQRIPENHTAPTSTKKHRHE